MFNSSKEVALFRCSRKTVASGAFFDVIPPSPGHGGPLQSFPGVNVATKAPKNKGRFKAVVNKVIYSTGGTAHQIVIASPCNFTIVAADVAAGATTITLDQDPGLYSTTYKYASLVGNIPAQAANNAIGSGHYIAVQLADGTWLATSVTSGTWSSYTSSLTIPALPNNNSIGIKAGALCYFFGNVTTDVDPATGRAQPQTLIAASQTRDTSWSDANFGIAEALHEGAPLLFYSPNTSAQGYLEHLSGYYRTSV